MLTLSDIALIITSISSVTGLGGIFYLRRKQKANAEAAEANTAKIVVDVVKDSFGISIEQLKAVISDLKTDNLELRKSNEKVRKELRDLRKAIEAISICKYRAQCPVTAQLQGAADPA